jgi:GT2 family glycosyltransferase
VNEGIRASTAEFVFVLNPDCVMTQNILPGMIAFLRADSSIGLLAPMLRDASGELQLSCRAFPNYGTAIFNRYSLATKIFPGNPASRRYLMTDISHDEIRDVDWASGAAWLVPRSTFERTGLLDEAFFWSIEDVDFCQRVHRAGLRVVYYPKAQLVHGIGGSTRYARTRAIIARHRGMWRYYSKYLGPRGRVWKAITGTAVAAGIAGRCAAQLAAASARSIVGQSRSETSTGT